METEIFTHETEDDTSADIPDFLPKPPFRFCFVGSTGSGKTNLMKNLVFNAYSEYFKRVKVFSGTEDTLLEFESIYDKKDPDFEMWLHTGYDDDKLREFFTSAKRSEPSLVVLDDLQSEGVLSKQKSNSIDLIFTAGRHKNISVLVAVQKYKALKNNSRANNCSALFLFNLGNMKDLKGIWEEVSADIDFDEFKSLYRTATKEPYGFLYVNPKAPPEERFRDSTLSLMELSTESDMPTERVLKPKKGKKKQKSPKDTPRDSVSSRSRAPPIKRKKVKRFAKEAGRLVAHYDDGSKKHVEEDELRALLKHHLK